jgi:hypothetical protein
MTSMTSGDTAPHQGARAADSPLPLGDVPFTTVIAGTMASPKIPAGIGDSWRPTVARLLVAAPLAVVTVMTGHR